MREIKFRAWDKSSLTMIPNISKAHQLVLHLDEEDLVLMQYTNIQDKNGKDIFEKDIIRYTAKDGYQYLEMNGNIGVIKFVYCSWMIEDMKGSEFLMIYYKDIEVIGNFYENRDLLDAEVLKVKA